VLCDAFQRTGLKPPQKYVGSHLLRHSLADMLRKGASLDEIGDVLRHRAHDDNDLREVKHQRIALHRAALASWRRLSMTPLSVLLKQYIAMRRSLGFEMSFTERVLRKFAEFADRERAESPSICS
jgi:hypothetical protein